MIAAYPLITGAVCALVGAAILFWTFRRRGSALLLAAAGGAAGGLGSLLFMLPLEFCTFAAGEDGSSLPKTIDVIFGIGLMIVGAALLIAGVRWISLRLLRHQPLVIDSQPGVFRVSPLVPYLLLAPTLIILIAFLYYPSLDTFRLSTLLARLGARRTAFICVDNFTSLLTDASYMRSLLITLALTAAIVVIGLTLSLFVATMAYQPVKGARIYRTLLIWPYAISPVVAGIIFLLLFNPTGGLLNAVLRPIIGYNIGWLNDPNVALWSVIIASVWKSMGYNILFYIAGLQNVPADLKEAASIDGANVLQRFWHIVIPLLSPITFFLIITNMTYAFFETFGTIDALFGSGGPLNAAETLMYRIYDTGIVNNNLGKAAAESIVLFLMVIGITILQFRTTARTVNYGA
jgi:sn-glycerol 3-phosphate transport system permease protein